MTSVLDRKLIFGIVFHIEAKIMLNNKKFEFLQIFHILDETCDLIEYFAFQVYLIR